MPSKALIWASVPHPQGIEWNFSSYHMPEPSSPFSWWSRGSTLGMGIFWSLPFSPVLCSCQMKGLTLSCIGLDFPSPFYTQMVYWSLIVPSAISMFPSLSHLSQPNTDFALLWALSDTENTKYLASLCLSLGTYLWCQAPMSKSISTFCADTSKSFLSDSAYKTGLIIPCGFEKGMSRNQWVPRSYL